MPAASLASSSRIKSLVSCFTTATTHDLCVLLLTSLRDFCDGARPGHVRGAQCEVCDRDRDNLRAMSNLQVRLVREPGEG
jgi:hypothetical protein